MLIEPETPRASELMAEYEKAKARIAELEAQLEALKDPSAVSANMLRGTIAMPERFVLGEQELGRLRAKVAALERHLRAVLGYVKALETNIYYRPHPRSWWDDEMPEDDERKYNEAMEQCSASKNRNVIGLAEAALKGESK